MVTTFNPPSRPKAKPKAAKKKNKPPMGLIGLGVVCVALLIGVILLNNKASEASGRADALSASVLGVAEVVGAEEVTAESLADPEGLEATLGALNNSVAEQADEVALKTAELEQARANAARVQAELDLAKEAASDVQDQARILSSDLSQRESELKSLQQKYDADVARLKKEIAALKASAMKTDGSDTDEMADDMEEVEEVEPAEAMMEEKMEEEEAAPEDMAMNEAADDMGDEAATSGESFKGKPEESGYFSSYDYDGTTQELSIWSKGTGLKIRFFDVPESVASSMKDHYSFDLFYRFKLMDVYKSKPDAREYIENL